MKLNNIIKISFVASNLIKGFFRISKTEAVMDSNIPFVEIDDIKRPAALTISDKIESGNRVFQAKLTFLMCRDWYDELNKVSFLCETADGERYLIGDGERPYPVVTQQQNHPNNYKDNQLTEVVVNYSSSQIPPIIR